MLSSGGEGDTTVDFATLDIISHNTKVIERHHRRLAATIIDAAQGFNNSNRAQPHSVDLITGA